MVGLAGTSYASKQYNITYKVNEYLPDGNLERQDYILILIMGLASSQKLLKIV